ncbi:hypothetical protein ACINWCA157_D0008 (plasmid) [Acinetobacter radioresistens WC-A-157]|nr:hypothetical protein ACINWCA157_D0008 [Acinetobacter radioresistens WC-A-157]
MQLADTSSSFLQLHENCGKTNANEKTRRLRNLAESSQSGLYSSTTIRGLIRLASVNHSTGTGGFLKR